MLHRLVTLLAAFGLSITVMTDAHATAAASKPRASTSSVKKRNLATPLAQVTTIPATGSGAAKPTTKAAAPNGANTSSQALRPTMTDPAAWVPATFQTTLEAWLGAHPDVTSAAVAVAAGTQAWAGDAARLAPGGSIPGPSAAGAATPAGAVGNSPAGVHAGDRYPILSVTKTFTSALTLRAAEQGLFALDAPVPDVLGVHRPLQTVTIRQLLTHTSGLPDYTESPFHRAGTALTPIDAVNLATDAVQLSAPGSTVHYANANYLYLQLVLEQATGKPYATLLAELANEQGLGHTALEPPDRNGWAAGASGGIQSTVGDMARWGSLVFVPGKVLSPANAALLATVDDHGIGPGTWPICPCSTDAAGVHHYVAIGHHMASGGMWFFPATGVTVAVRIDPSGPNAAGLGIDLGGRMNALFGRL